MNSPYLKPQNNNDPDAGVKIGRWMIYGAWLLILLLLTVLFSKWLDHRHNPNQVLHLQQNAGGDLSIALQRNSAGHYVATGFINAKPVTFLLDTGATHVAIPGKLAHELGLEAGPMVSSMTANGRVKSYLTLLDRVELGPIRLTDVQASIIPTMPTDEVLLGMSFLKHLELLQRGNQLVIRVPGQD